MDYLDYLTDRLACGLCDRPVRFGEDFCAECRRVAGGRAARGLADVRVDVELTAKGHAAVSA